MASKLGLGSTCYDEDDRPGTPRTSTIRRLGSHHREIVTLVAFTSLAANPHPNCRSSQDTSTIDTEIEGVPRAEPIDTRV